MITNKNNLLNYIIQLFTIANITIFTSIMSDEEDDEVELKKKGVDEIKEGSYNELKSRDINRRL